MGTEIGTNEQFIENGGCKFYKSQVKRYGYENVGNGIEIKKYYIDFNNGTRVEYLEQDGAEISKSGDLLNFFGFNGGLIRGSDKKDLYSLDCCTGTKVDVFNNSVHGDDAVRINEYCNNISIFSDYHDDIIDYGNNTRIN